MGKGKASEKEDGAASQGRPSMTPEQLGEIKAAFQLFDKENTGQIYRKELGCVMHVLGLNPDDKEIRELLALLDPDALGTIDFEPFQAVAIKWLQDVEAMDELREAFYCLDKDGDGEIINSEIIECLTTMGDKFNEDEIRGFITMADPEGKGSFNYANFITNTMKKK